MTLDVYIEAEYADGYIHREDEVDASSYVEGKNIFSDILERRPESEHGPTVRFSLITPDEDFHVDFNALPANARPVRYMHVEGDFLDGGLIDRRILSIDFGYQYTDDDGNNVQEIVEIL